LRFGSKISDQHSDVNSSVSLGVVPPLHGSRSGGYGGENIVGSDRSADALEFKFSNRLDGNGFFERHQDARADKNLTGLGFVAKARGNIGYCADGGIVEPTLEA
jgi:hypothetical protein